MFARSGPTPKSHISMLNEETLPILVSAFACEGNCRKSRRTNCFCLASSLIFEMPISGGSAKRLWHLFLVPIAWYNIFQPRFGNGKAFLPEGFIGAPAGLMVAAHRKWR
jgi:hypothetical protein